MFRMLAEHLKDVSVLRRLVFATSHLPRDISNHTGIVVEFATHGKVERNHIIEETAKAIIENIESFDPTAFSTDEDLFKQLLSFKSSASGPLGIVLISPKSTCTLCGENLCLRKDRPSTIVIYDDTFGTASGSHYHKHCSSRTCTVHSTMDITQQGKTLPTWCIIQIGKVFHILFPPVKLPFP